MQIPHDRLSQLFISDNLTILRSVVVVPLYWLLAQDAW